MDWITIGTSIATALISIGVVAKFFDKIIPKATKYLKVAHDALEIAEEAVEALKDGKITKEEIAVIQETIVELKAHLKE